MREQTQELATWALSDSGSIRTASAQGRPQKPISEASTSPRGRSASVFSDPDPRSSSDSNRPEAIPEVSEPTSPELEPFATGHRLSRSALSDVIRSSSAEASHSATSSTSRVPVSSSSRTARSSLRVADASGWRSGEVEPLISKDRESVSGKQHIYGSASDVERQVHRGNGSWDQQSVCLEIKRKFYLARQRLLHSKFWTREALWENFVLAPTYAIPAVLLGLLLNILDALSYGTEVWLHLTLYSTDSITGMILFPLGEKIFQHTGADGISMFYVSCIVSQLVYSGGGSVFKGGVGSEMVGAVLLMPYHQRSQC